MEKQVLRKLRGFSNFHIYSLTDYICVIMSHIGNTNEEIGQIFCSENLTRMYQLEGLKEENPAFSCLEFRYFLDYALPLGCVRN